MSDTITIYVDPDDTDTTLTESETEEVFSEFLSETGEAVTIMGYEFDAGRALKAIDPIAYRVEYLNYVDSFYHELSIPTDIWFRGDREEIAEWVEANID